MLLPFSLDNLFSSADMCTDCRGFLVHAWHPPAVCAPEDACCRQRLMDVKESSRPAPALLMHTCVCTPVGGLEAGQPVLPCLQAHVCCISKMTLPCCSTLVVHLQYGAKASWLAHLTACRLTLRQLVLVAYCSAQHYASHSSCPLPAPPACLQALAWQAGSPPSGPCCAHAASGQLHASFSSCRAMQCCGRHVGGEPVLSCHSGPC